MMLESSFTQAIIGALRGNSQLAVSLSILCSFLAWRLLAFTVIPLVYPNDPKEYPHWVPVVGHLRSFFKDSSKLLSEARLYFHDTREPFALSVAGQKWYVLTKPEDVSATYKIDNGSLSYDIFAIEVMRMVGVTEDGIQKAFRTSFDEKDANPSGSHKHLVRLCKEYQLEQLSPGSRLSQLVLPGIKLMGDGMNSESILKRAWYASSKSDSDITVSLYQWVSDIFIDIGTKAYFGRQLQEMDKDLTRTFMVFESLSWQAMYQYPTFLCGKMTGVKQSLQRALLRYFALPKEDRNDMSWFMSKIEEETERLNISADDRAIFFFQLFWSINGNTRKAPFWILSYLLFDRDLLEQVRRETAHFVRGSEIDLESLLDERRCPQLSSIWEEATRLTAFAASVRFLIRDIEIGGKILRKGNRLMMPQRQLHFNEKVFGKDATKFNSDRFLENPSLRRHSSMRPFGGGTSMCPGRNLAKQLTFAFLAMALDRFEITLDPPNQPFPEPAEGKPSIGLVDVQEGQDLQIRLQARSSK